MLWWEASRTASIENKSVNKKGVERCRGVSKKESGKIRR